MITTKAANQPKLSETIRNYPKPSKTIQSHPKFLATNHKLPEILHKHYEIIVSITFCANPCRTYINNTPTITQDLNHEISPNNAKHHKQEASLLVSISIVQITLIKSEQSPEYFCSVYICFAY